MWVKSEYAGEVAVLSTWVCALLPWSVTVFQRELTAGSPVTAIWIRFLPGRFLYVFGLGFSGESPYRWVWEVSDFVATPGETTASYIWLVGVAVFLVGFVVSIAYYLDKERLEEGPVDPVRLLGALLVLTGLVLLAASVVLWQSQAGTIIPIGVLFQLGLGGLLLRIERT